MGKKKIAKESTEDVLKAGAAIESAVAQSGSKGVKGKKKFDKGRIYIKSSYNNTFLTVTDEKGHVIAWSSAGSLGFNGPKKATPFAASKVVSALAEKLKKTGPFDVQVFVSGIGGGRDSSIRSLMNQGFNLSSIKDITPIPHNGPRPRKVRRV